MGKQSQLLKRNFKEDSHHNSAENISCSCQSSLDYSVCCKPFHLGTSQPQTAEALSRARHSAYVLKNAAYIFKTWDKKTRPSEKTVNLLMPETYTNYEVVNKDMGLEKHDIGTVTIISSFCINDRTHEIKELSFFKRIEGNWVYYKGEIE